MGNDSEQQCNSVIIYMNIFCIKTAATHNNNNKILEIVVIQYKQIGSRTHRNKYKHTHIHTRDIKRPKKCKDENNRWTYDKLTIVDFWLLFFIFMLWTHLFLDIFCACSLVARRGSVAVCVSVFVRALCSCMCVCLQRPRRVVEQVQGLELSRQATQRGRVLALCECIACRTLGLLCVERRRGLCGVRTIAEHATNRPLLIFGALPLAPGLRGTPAPRTAAPDTANMPMPRRSLALDVAVSTCRTAACSRPARRQSPDRPAWVRSLLQQITRASHEACELF